MTREVLLIEDDAAYRHSIAILFRGEPYRFVGADSPEEGMAALDANPQIRVVILDLSFPQPISGDQQPLYLAGTAFLDYIKGRSDDYRVIVLTGHDELLRAERAGEYAIFNYLPKAERSSSQAIRFSVDQAFKDLEREHLARKNSFLLDVQKRISAGGETKETLDLICQSVRSTVGAFTCHIRVYDFTAGDYHLKGFAGPDERMRYPFEIPKAKGDLFSGRVVETRRAAAFDDLQRMESFRRFAAATVAGREVSPEEERYWRDVRSAYIVPISTGLFEEAIDAVLNVSSETVSFFGAEKQTLVDEFVTQAALAITKDWLQRKRREIHQDYSEIARMLSDMSDRLGERDGLTETYEVVTRRIADIVNPEVISIFLYNESTKRLENVAELRGNEPVDASGEAYRPGQSLTGSVFKKDETIQLPEPGGAKRVSPLADKRYDHANKEGYLSNIPSGTLEHYLAVPIRIGGKIRGVLRAMNKTSSYYGNTLPGSDRLCLLERGFSADCRNVMEITASHLAVAIRNAELITEKDRRVQQLSSLGAVGRLINSALKLDELLELTTQKMAEVMQAEICMLFLKEGDDRIVLKLCEGMPMIPRASYKLGEGVTGQVAETGNPRLIMTTDENDGKYDLAIRRYLTKKHGRKMHIESLMVVPIVAKSTILGAMKVINKIGDHLKYSASDLEFFTTFADYVGVAIDNAQSYSGLSLLVAAVAHEINNTSGLIPANVDGIREHLTAPNANIDRMLTRIEDAAGQATEFANELAGFSANRMGEKGPVNINQVIRTAIDSLEYRKPESIKVKVALCRRPLLCEIYERPFVQIVRNIVINAFQALENKKRGIIDVSTSKGTGDAAGTAVIIIADNGPGIRSQDKERIFDPDFTTKPKGNGVGLWLVRTHLRLVGGTIEVESQPNHGAKFIVRIPILSHGGGELNESN
ncbi:MAG TPA: GAF domain-containing protein [Thermoanaerobaculia bacterium]|nr:GAF domain-containing protein [Thermoanaerobaculia bacterium]